MPGSPRLMQVKASPPKMRSAPNHPAKRSSSPRPFISTRMRVPSPAQGPTSSGTCSIAVALSAQTTQSTCPISALLRAIEGASSVKSPSLLSTRRPPAATAS